MKGKEEVFLNRASEPAKQAALPFQDRRQVALLQDDFMGSNKGVCLHSCLLLFCFVGCGCFACLDVVLQFRAFLRTLLCFAVFICRFRAAAAHLKCSPP